MDHKQVKFFVTGYGAFSTFSLNPTDYVVNKMKKNPSKFITEDGNYHLEFFRVSDVSAIGALQTLLDLQSCHNQVSSKDDICVFFHLGVYGDATEVNLEQRGYNEAKWDNPDTRNWTPRCQKVSIDSFD